jgi:lysophospholipase L1-like esterase
MKINEAAKSIIVGIVVPLVFFFSLEAVQRVRWYFKSDRSAYWLLYGFVGRPKDFDQQITRIAARRMSKRTAGKNVYEIQIWEKVFPNGIKKHNPDLPEYKGIVNSLGFRSHEFTPRKGPGVYRIIATGGSTTAGYESDVDHTYPALLEKILNESAKGDKRFEVINAGIGEEEVPYVNSLLESELAGYGPDMATLYLTFNHLHMRRGSISIPEDFYYKVYKFKEWLSGKSLLFLTLREKFNLVFKREGPCLGDIYIPTKDPRTLAAGFLNTPEVFESYRIELEKFISICGEHNITPVFMTEACVCKNNTYLILGKGMEPVYKKMYGIMEQVAKKHNVIFIDTAKLMDAVPGKERYFTDGLHLTSEGNAVLAGIIYSDLKKSLD